MVGREQVEAAIREALRSAFGYGLDIPTAGVPAETLEAATLAAGSAAVAEGTKQLLEGKASSPTARYLDDLSPAGGGSGGGDAVASIEAAEKGAADGLWMGGEAAAYAAGAAAGVGGCVCAVVCRDCYECTYPLYPWASDTHVDQCRKFPVRNVSNTPSNR